MMIPVINKSKQTEFNETQLMLNRTGLLKLCFLFCRTYSTHGIEEECIQGFGRKLKRKDTNRKT
jgi:hypothetical protein